MARRRRYIYAGRKQSNKRNIARGTAAAIIMVAVIYFVAAGGLGTFIADKLILPYMGGAGGGDEPVQPVGETPSPTQQATGQPTPSAAPSAGYAQELTLRPMPFYGIQMGAFGNQANAETQAGNTQRRGGAGYIYKDEDRYRVLASAYLSRDDANKVKQQLLSQQGVESYVLDLYTDVGEVTLRITAQPERIAAMQEALAGFSQALDSLEDISRRLDTGEIGPAAAREEVGVLALVVDEKRAALTDDAQLEGESVLMEEMAAIMLSMAQSMWNVEGATGSAAMEISSQIKYTYVESLDKYGSMLRGVMNRAA